jgi:hypothetical protein
VEICIFREMKKQGEIIKMSTIPRGQGKEDNKQKNLERARIRAGSTVRELIKANELDKHWVLTYAVPVIERAQATKDFVNFIQRLNYKLSGNNIPYVAVLEIQEERAEKYGDKVWHFHLATNRYIKHSIMLKAWGHGGVRVKKHETGTDGVASYLTKYLKKDMEKYEAAEKKRYLCSKGLKRAEKDIVFLDNYQKIDLIEKSEYNKDFDVMKWAIIKRDVFMKAILDKVLACAY